jgi:hypothetical protein
MYEDFYLDRLTELIFGYLSNLENKEFNDVNGYDLLTDLTNIFSLNTEDGKKYIRLWFSEFYINDNWFDKIKDIGGLVWVPWRTIDTPIQSDAYMSPHIRSSIEDYLYQPLNDEMLNNINNMVRGELNHITENRYIGSVDVATNFDSDTCVLNIMVVPAISVQRIETSFTITRNNEESE